MQHGPPDQLEAPRRLRIAAAISAFALVLAATLGGIANSADPGNLHAADVSHNIRSADTAAQVVPPRSSRPDALGQSVKLVASSSPTGSSAAWTVQRGSMFTATGGGFATRSSVSVWLEPSKWVIGNVSSDERGDFEGVFLMPTTVVPGVYRMMVDGLDPQGLPHELSRPLTVTPGVQSFGVTSMISGHVLNASTSLGISGICVTVFAPDGVAKEGEDTTGAQGLFTISGLHAGDHKVQFTDCGEHAYATTWYPAEPTSATATVLSTSPGGERIGVDVGLQVTGAPRMTLSVAPTAHPETPVTWVSTHQASMSPIPQGSPGSNPAAQSGTSADSGGPARIALALAALVLLVVLIVGGGRRYVRARNARRHRGTTG